MNELIAITSRPVNGQEIQTVNARELHAFLEVQTPFKDWIARRIEEYGFQEGKDFCAFLRESSGGRPAKEYALSIDMAKELSMVERNEKGKQARQYFLECERRAKNPAPMEALADPAFLRSTLLSYTEKVIALEAKVEEQAPKVAALDRIEASPEHLTLTQAAKVLNIKIGKLTELLHRERWVYRQNGSWVPYHPRIEQGLLIYKEAKYTDGNAGVECIKPYCHITQKGIAKLAVFQSTSGRPDDKAWKESNPPVHDYPPEGGGFQP
jgi:anti-repressor protein